MTGRLHGTPRSWIACVALALAGSPSAPATASGSDVDAALSSMAGEIADVRKSCNEPVTISAKEIALSDRVTGVHVVLKGGTCLGWFGRYDYLLVRDPAGRWRTIQDGGPGVLNSTRRRGQRVAKIEVRSVNGCTTTLTWTGREYRQRASAACGEVRKAAGWSILESVIRASGT